jgi:ribonuclease J
MEIGDVLSITDKSARINSRVPAGGVLVDGMALGELEGSALKERRELSEEGLVAVSIVLDKNGLLAKEPVFESRGFIHMKDATALKEELVKTINQVLGSIAGRGEKIDDEEISGRLKSRMAEVIRKNSKNRPVIISLVSRITSEKK